MEEKVLYTLKTPRGTIRVKYEFESLEAARAEGWGLWFQHGDYLILGRYNRTGAVVKVKSA